MFRYLNNVLVPFDYYAKLNVKNSFVAPTLFRIFLSCSDLRQKEETLRAVTLMFINFNLGGSLPLYRDLKKSVSRFKTRKGDPSGIVSILQNDNMFAFLELALRHELYVYTLTLKRQHLNVSDSNAVAASFPDVKYLFYFRNSLIHTLTYTLGFDISASVSLPDLNIELRDSLVSLFLSAFAIYYDEN